MTSSTPLKYARAIFRAFVVFFLSLNITGCDSDPTLSDLTLSSGVLNPEFRSHLVSYTASVDFSQESITVTPVATEAGATITVNGNAVASGSPSPEIELAVGSNVIRVGVTSPDGDYKVTYKVDVTRAAANSSDATLSDLTLSAGVLDQVFQSDNFAYTASLGYLQQSVSVIPVATDPNATITANGAAVISGNPSAPIALAEGSNVISVVVTAADGTTTETYTVDVTRGSAASFAQQAYLKASNAEAGDFFGFSVALSGDTLAVGAHNEDSSATGGESDNSARDAGAVYVFTRSGGVWGQQAVLKASNAGAQDLFGFRVALSGDTLVVGAPQEDSSATGGESDDSADGAGAAYVYTRTSGVWSQQAYLKASNAEAGDNFGSRVALSGDTLVVSAGGEDSSATGGESDNSADGAGAAYVFTRTSGVWNQQAYLKASNAEAGDRLGSSVALSGDTLVVGVPYKKSSATGGESDNLAPNAGVAYVFTRTSGVWSQQAYLKASNAEAGDYFGFKVALSGDTLVVGAFGEDSSATGGENDNSAIDAGAVYVFTRSGGVWSQQAYLKASNAEADDMFGFSIDLSGDTLVVGAIQEDSSATGGESDNSASWAGAAYVFTRTSGVWSQQAYLKASNAGEYDQFGFSVAISDDTLAVGAWREGSSAAGGESDNSASDAGAVYIWH